MPATDLLKAIVIGPCLDDGEVFVLDRGQVAGG